MGIAATVSFRDVPSRPERPEGLIVVYDGGVLSDAEITEIVLTDGELGGFAFVARDGVAGLVTPLLTRRVASCLDAVNGGRGRGAGERQSGCLMVTRGVRPEAAVADAVCVGRSSAIRNTGYCLGPWV